MTAFESTAEPLELAWAPFMSGWGECFCPGLGRWCCGVAAPIGSRGGGSGIARPGSPIGGVPFGSIAGVGDALGEVLAVISAGDRAVAPLGSLGRGADDATCEVPSASPPMRENMIAPKTPASVAPRMTTATGFHLLRSTRAMGARD
jgi:hypothetical protein